MNQKSLSRWLKVITVIAGLTGLAFYIGIFPSIVNDLGNSFPEFKHLVTPSLIGIWASAIPCYLCLFLFWSICTRIGQDRSFSHENAKALQWIGKLALLDGLLCLGVTVMLIANNACNAGTFLIAFAIMLIGIAIAVASMALSHLVLKAAQLKDDNDLTI